MTFNRYYSAFAAIALLLALCFAQAAVADGVRAEELFKEGNSLVEQGKYRQALAVLEQGITLDNGNYMAYINLGIAYAELEEHEKANKAFSSAVSLNPQEPAGYLNRGEVSALMDDYDNACKDWQAACRLDLCKRLDIAILKVRCEAE